ncbi:MAG: hypothetical protein ABIO62_13220 [Paracoccaceae bacterium]
MITENRTSDEIERDNVQERSRLAGSINDLQKKFSAQGIIRDLGEMFRDQGGELTRSMTRVVGRNPAAVALVGAGLAWLIIGQNRNGEGAGGVSNDGSTGTGTTSGPHRRKGQFLSDEASWLSDHGTQASAPRSGADSPTDTMMSSIRQSAGAAAEAVSDTAGAVRDKAMDITTRLLSGTEGFSAEAKARVLSARQAAYDARLASEATFRRGKETANSIFEAQPIAVGALAVALGAAIGSALPHSQLEDNTLGESSDALFAEAQAIFREEQTKAVAVLKTAAGEAKAAIQDAGSDLVDRVTDGKSPGAMIVDRVADAATRIVDSAKSEAENQGLGHRHT